MKVDGVIIRHITRRDFLRLLGAAAAAVPATSALGGCVQVVTPAAVGEPAAPAVGGQLDFYSWEGYDMLAATQKWREENKVELKSGYIASSEDTPAKVLSPAGKGIDVITYFYAYYKSWADNGIFSEFTAEEVPEIKNMYKFFQEKEFWRASDGKYIGVPLTWLTYVINYRSDLIDRPQHWADLLDSKFKGKLAIVEDPGANILVASKVLGYDTGKMTRQQMDEVKKFLLALKANAKTIAPSYGDLNNLLISGEVVATFVGWGALNVWAAKDNVTVESVEPEDGIVISVDAYAIPPTTDNRATALAWLNLMLTKEVQVAVAEELLTAVVRPDAVELIKDEQIRNLYSYDDVDGFMNKHGLNLFPSPETGAEVTFADWLKMWEEVKAG